MSKNYDPSWEDALTVVGEAQPPFIPEGAHAMTVVIAHRPIACPRRCLGKMRISKVWLSGISGPPHNPWPMRKATSDAMSTGRHKRSTR